MTAKRQQKAVHFTLWYIFSELHHPRSPDIVAWPPSDVLPHELKTGIGRLAIQTSDRKGDVGKSFQSAQRLNSSMNERKESKKGTEICQVAPIFISSWRSIFLFLMSRSNPSGCVGNSVYATSCGGFRTILVFRLVSPSRLAVSMYTLFYALGW